MPTVSNFQTILLVKDHLSIKDKKLIMTSKDIHFSHPTFDMAQINYYHNKSIFTIAVSVFRLVDIYKECVEV